MNLRLLQHICIYSVPQLYFLNFIIFKGLDMQADCIQYTGEMHHRNSPLSLSSAKQFIAFWVPLEKKNNLIREVRSFSMERFGVAVACSFVVADDVVRAISSPPPEKNRRRWERRSTKVQHESLNRKIWRNANEAERAKSLP